MADGAGEALRIERVDAAHVRLSGALGFSEAGLAYARYDELIGGSPKGATVAVDVAGLRRVDSATLAVLLAWAAQAARSGRRLHLDGVPAGLRALARLCQAEPLLGIA